MVSPRSKARSAAITQGDIGEQLVRLTLPMMLALLSIMGLGIVDSYFISFLGTAELAAIGFSMPVTSVVTSIALGLGMAISSLTSRLMGEDRGEHAARLITDGFLLTLGVAITVITLLFFTQAEIFRALGARPETVPLIQEYMQVWLIGVPFIMLTTVCSSTFRAIGDTSSAAQIAIMMTLTNIVLDPLFIFGLGPIPAFGIAGAAAATVCAVLIAFTFASYRLGVVERLLVFSQIQLAEFKQHLKSLTDIAIPAVLANSIVPLIATALTAIVATLGTDAVAGFGVVARVEAMSLMTVYALSSTLPMFIGQNLGAKKLDRISAAVGLAFRFVFILQTSLAVLLYFTGPFIASIFTDEPEVAKVIVLFLAIVPFSHGLAGNTILINVAMNVLGKPRWALYINLARLLILTVPLAYIGLQIGELEGLLIGILLGNILAFVIAKRLFDKVLALHNVPKVGLIKGTSAHLPEAIK
ncbi:MAG: MATE family efflux transporter [Arenicella sp.]|nr:MATE family efflux transporter [Arenicella sp.]HAU69175.1 MATE family efflux transporter [Gammaproteobacteria bacterium]